MIWADDECDTLNCNLIEGYFDERDIGVLAFVPTSEALQQALESYKDKVDAVIVDGNFSKKDVDNISSTDISGLIHTLSIIEVTNARRDIPFFLYTAKKMMLQENCKNNELDYFLETERLIQKGDMETLADKIIADVSKINSPEHWVRKKYKSLIDMAQSVDAKSVDNICQYLIDEARGEATINGTQPFNDLRLVLEGILEKCKKKGIVPEAVNSLNDFGNYWFWQTRENAWRAWNGYVPADNVMPQPIAYLLSRVIDITQDGSHNFQDPGRGRLYVQQYAYDTKTPFLFRSCLYLVIDVIRWYKETEQKIDNGELNPPLYSVRGEGG